MAGIYCSFCSAGRHPSYPDNYELNFVANPEKPSEGIVVCDGCRVVLQVILSHMAGGTTTYLRVRRDGMPMESVRAVEEAERIMGFRT
ncbi:MAG: hypothetical protein RLZZ200_1644 [Pseudomonadota bacterium]|jgi:hypothetical protein